ncbi:MAG: type II toxin-antitoxin system HicA family toxin [Candidatus Cryptobacteroides sp.]
MKYNELEKLLRKAGCYPTGRQQGGHPLWFSPKTGKSFQTSNHGSQEVASGTLKKILKDAGLK